jgi:hypothetical protein
VYTLSCSIALLGNGSGVLLPRAAETGLFRRFVGMPAAPFGQEMAGPPGLGTPR